MGRVWVGKDEFIKLDESLRWERKGHKRDLCCLPCIGRFVVSEKGGIYPRPPSNSLPLVLLSLRLLTFMGVCVWKIDDVQNLTTLWNYLLHIINRNVYYSWYYDRFWNYSVSCSLVISKYNFKVLGTWFYMYLILNCTDFFKIRKKSKKSPEIINMWKRK